MLELAESRKLAYKEFLTAHARMLEVIDAELAEAGLLPLTWYDVLVTLECSENQRLRMSDLAEQVLLSRSGLTRLIDKLEQKGFVLRQNCPSDRRGTHAVLTEAGLQAREASWPLYSSLIQELFGAQMSDEDAERLATVMNRVTSAVSHFKTMK